VIADTIAILAQAERERALYRLMLSVSQELLHEAGRTIARQREQLREHRDERERLARSVFGE
jgi:histidinol dehydrogenase